MSCLQTQLFEARPAQRSELATGGQTSSPYPPVAWLAEMPALSESFFLFNSHDNSIRSSRERNRFIAVQYNICKQILTKIKHDYNKTTLQRMIFIDNNLNNKLLLLLLFHYQKYFTLDRIIIIPPHRLLSCFNGMQICLEILTVNHNNIYCAIPSN
jgi:hypothetical protein